MWDHVGTTRNIPIYSTPAIEDQSVISMQKMTDKYNGLSNEKNYTHKITRDYV
jgi:hypothetical protein